MKRQGISIRGVTTEIKNSIEIIEVKGKGPSG